MVPKTHLDELQGNDSHSLPCLLEETLLRYPAIKAFFAPLISLVVWIMELFNPPPLESMNLAQRAGRVVFLTLALVIASILFAMAGAVGLYLMERGRELRDTPQFYHGLLIVLIGIAVNIACVFVLFQVKRADTKLLPPPDQK
jgi:uncharacterized membrane protein YidH (DUF202 family)